MYHARTIVRVPKVENRTSTTNNDSVTVCEKLSRRIHLPCKTWRSFRFRFGMKHTSAFRAVERWGKSQTSQVYSPYFFGVVYCRIAVYPSSPDPIKVTVDPSCWNVPLSISRCVVKHISVVSRVKHLGLPQLSLLTITRRPCPRCYNRIIYTQFGEGGTSTRLTDGE